MVAERTRQDASRAVAAPATALRDVSRDKSPDASSQAPLRAVAATCRNGHERTSENTTRHAEGSPNCLTCRREWYRESRRRLRAQRQPAPPRTACRNGHPRTPETSVLTKWGRVCRVCAAARGRGVRRAVCRNGHRQTFKTTFKDKGNHWRCRPCIDEWRDRYRHRGGAPRRTHCQRGHELTPENTGQDGASRYCRTCYRERNRASRARQAAQTPRDTAPTFPAPHATPERPLEGFGAIAAAVADKARAYTPTRFSDAVAAGLRERRAREAVKRAGVVTPEAVIAAAAETFGVTVKDLEGKARDKEIVWPRQLAYYLVRELCGLGLSKTGRAFGGRDHTTVFYGVAKVERLVAAGDRETLRDLELVREALGEVGA